MAPKSAKPKKQLLVLVVSTPTVGKGQKSKVKDDSGKGKGKKKKGESSFAPALERNVLYFAEDKAQERCNDDFSLRKVLNGRWINYNFFDYDFEYSTKMDNLGWKSMTTMRDDVYPDLVAHFYVNATRNYGQDSTKSYVKGVSTKLDTFVVQNILGAGFGGKIYRENIIKDEQLSILYGRAVDEYV